jgi:hypothetical protein
VWLIGFLLQQRIPLCTLGGFSFYVRSLKGNPKGHANGGLGSGLSKFGNWRVVVQSSLWFMGFGHVSVSDVGFVYPAFGGTNDDELR